MNIIRSISRILYNLHYKIQNTYEINDFKIIEKRIKKYYTKLLNILKNKIYKKLDIKNIYLHFNKAKFIINKHVKTKNKYISAKLLNKSYINNYKKVDVSLPGRKNKIGKLHPITVNINYIKNFFFNLGFSFVSGPEIVDSYNNFDVLNIPLDHPARSEKDSFWIKKYNILLRTHTTSVQIRMMKEKEPPFKSFSIGKVYRIDNDPTHTPMFHQLEGLVVDKKVSLSNLKYIVHHFLSYYFNNDLKIRYRPSYFPFTEPSIEVDIYKNKRWLEILGCGLLHPKVLTNIGLNPKKDQALAFGIGIERLIMVKYNIPDIRILYENNLRFLTKF